MKTSEFISRIKELGYEVDNFDGHIEIYRDNHIFVRVGKNAVNVLDTNYYVDIPDDLFNVLVEYAVTPVGEREDAKGYYLYNPVRQAYFNYHTMDRYYVWSNSTPMVGIQTKFTEEEIEDNRFRDIMELLVKEEVEDE